MKRLAAVLATMGAATLIGLAVAPAASAGTPNPHGNCTAFEATQVGDISHYATLPHPGTPDYVAGASSTDCGQR